ncbi:SDR family NAD(P)-dependent oxidoreductase [Poseidonibacter ostreae]|jgi:NAD(P)-dependent dehydrogenase (short-subunit alcohol dehydrogenase family)|uniref:SDR family oxidoreductase n=1 Tax=Poseidonibacter ostreae TaxID=2654171 RepID=A0A6L4WTD5_9BACT|nr:SDR family oxidoreductase [Poseidonibacter ostreae]KAB7885861.1 SDR family oxidoreductase [Poseidonibacter ostreae]KAB7887000.1 SDR family oxidoreductase [Poseidonibacter ostreae]KAB7889331.1 SDR family oxidoreductase [Poseidonibacter ostreae]
MSKKVLITGGNKGIGLAVSRAMLELDYEVIVVARDFEDFVLGGLPNVTEIEYDLSNIDGLEVLVKKIGNVDILINNAGFMQPKYSYDNYPKEAKEKILNVDLHAPVELMNLLCENMKAQKYGRIVNVASIAGQIGHPDIWYGIAKAGLINATKIYGKLLGAHGITVNCVAPSPTETDMQKDNSEQRKKEFKKTVSSGRFAQAEEVAKAIVWLATDCPTYINGVTLDINDCSYAR